MSKEKVSRQTSTYQIGDKRSILLITILASLTFIQTLGYSYSPLDDTMLIIKRLDWLLDGSWAELFTKGVFKTEGSDYYRPLLIITFKIDALIGKGNPLIFHLTNVILHIVSSILCFTFLKKLIKVENALMFSLLFAAHPLAAHTVAWIPGRNDSLLAVFVLSSMIAFQLFLDRKKLYWLVVHILLFFCVLLTKESAIIFPVILAIYYFLFDKEKTKFKSVFLIAIWLILTFCWYLLKNNAVKTLIDFSLFDFQKIFIDSFLSVVIYIGKIFLPFNQAILPNVTDTPIIIGIIVTGLLIFVAVKFKINNIPLFIFGIAWFLLFLSLPLLLATFDGIGIHYEHRIYVPLIGFFLALNSLKFNVTRKYAWFLVFLVFFLIKTIVRSQVYKNTFSFSVAAAEESPSSSMAFNMLGSEFNNQGKYREAIEAYTRSIELDTNKYTALFNRGFAYKNWGMYEMALADYNKGLKHDSLNAKAYLDRGNIYFDLGIFKLAIADFTKAIDIYPQYSNAHNNRGNAYANLKQFDQALTDYTKAIQFRKTNASAYNNRGNVYAELGDLQKALADYEKAVQFKPKDVDFRKNLQACLQQINQPQVAKKNGEINISEYEQKLLPMAYDYYKKNDFQNALRVFLELSEETKQRNMIPNYLSHQNNVALCFIKLGNVVESEQILLEIIKTDQKNERAYSNLGLLYKTMGLKDKAIEMYAKALAINPENQKARGELNELKK